MRYVEAINMYHKAFPGLKLWECRAAVLKRFDIRAGRDYENVPDFQKEGFKLELEERMHTNRENAMREAVHPLTEKYEASELSFNAYINALQEVARTTPYN